MENIVKELPLAILMAPPPAGADEKLLWFVITSGIVDRDYEILDPDGMRVQTFMEKNPVFCYDHDLYLPAIGRVERLTKEAGRWLAGVRFADGERYPFAGLIRYLFEDGIMNSVSIRFRPIKWEDAAYEEFGYYRKFTEFELLEVSAVNIPANPDATMVRGEEATTAGTKDSNGTVRPRLFSLQELSELGRQARESAPAWVEPLKADLILSIKAMIADGFTSVKAMIEQSKTVQTEQPDEGTPGGESATAGSDPGRGEKTAVPETASPSAADMRAMVRQIVADHINYRRGVVSPGQVENH